MTTEVAMPPTPELDKMRAARGESLTLTRFWDWLHGQEIALGKYHEHGPACHGWDHHRDKWNPDYDDHDNCGLSTERLNPHHERPESVFARFFGIDLAKVEDERRAILAAISTREDQRE